MDAPIFSVIIPTYNRKAALLRCLASLERQSIAPERYEVIVVIDGSGDDTASAVRGCSVPFRLHILEIDRGGPGRARNEGAARASGVYLAFTEDDVEIPPSWLVNAERHIAESPCSLLEGVTLDAVSGRSVRRFDAGRQPSFIPCNLIVSRAVFLQLGGYSAEYFDKERNLYFREDADFGFRLLDAGHNVTFADDVVVKHPPQFTTVGQCYRHVRRYEFDPLLYKQHPRRFREMIEVKRMLGVTIRRPQHYLALVSAVAYLGFLAGILIGHFLASAVCCVVMLAGGILFAYKYRGREIFHISLLPVLLRLLSLPLVYCFSFLRGCFRHKSVGALV